MYFKDRTEAGKKLAAQLQKFRYENTAVMALSEGAVIVGEQIARSLHTTLQLLLTEQIQLPDLGGDTVGLIDEIGQFTYNDLIPAGVLEEVMSEDRPLIEAQKLEKISKINQLLGEYGFVDPHIYYGRTVIIVSDGLKSGMSFAAAVNFLKPIKTEKIVAAVPFVSVPAVDQLHVLSDEICVLSVIDNFMDVNHYYENNVYPPAKQVLDSINNVVTRWA